MVTLKVNEKLQKPADNGSKLADFNLAQAKSGRKNAGI